MQKYESSRQTHKITIVLPLKLYNILLYTARIAYENTYLRHARILALKLPKPSTQNLLSSFRNPVRQD